MSDSYPSWLPKRPPPPVPPASTYQSSADPHPRVTDVFATPGRKPTPRSVRIMASNVPWREPTGDSAETRVPSRPQRLSRAPQLPPPPPRPRFRAPSLHLSLLRSPALSMRIRYMLHPVFIFSHLLVQTYFDFNVVFMLLQVSSHPGPSNSPRNWSLAAAAYIACYALQIIAVFLLYEVIYSFWRRWRVKRPLILPIYLSSPAHDLAALTSYTHFCFFTYIRRSARPPWPSLSYFRSSSIHLSSSPPPSSPVPSSSSPAISTSSNNSSLFAYSDYIAESCYWYSQNMPTVMLLLPRAALSLSLLLTSSQPGAGRDSTFFDVNGALTGYARGILFANAAWTAWRTFVLIGSILGLWILSGTACAGLCGPRYRWEEDEDHSFEPWEKRVSDSNSPQDATHPYPYPHATAPEGDDMRGISDGWSWKQGTRERVREAWEFCLTSIRPGPGRGYDTANVRAHVAHEEDFAGLEEVLAAVPKAMASVPRSVLSGDFYSPMEGREALSDIIPPAEEVRDAFGSQRSRRSDPLRVLPYPFKEFQAGVGVEKGKEDEKGKAKEVPEGPLIPFPSPVPSPEEELEAEDEDGEEEEVQGEVEDEDQEEEEEDEEGDENGEEGEEVEADEEDIVEGRRTSESMSSLGQPISSRYPFAFRRTSPSSASAAAVSPQHSYSSPSTRGSRSTPSTYNSRGSRAIRSTPSNKESTDSPRTPPSGSGSPQTPFIPPPRRHPTTATRRRRAGTAPSLPSSPIPDVPVVGPSPAQMRMRTRTISASGSSVSLERRFDPEPEALYESGDDDDNDDEHGDGHEEGGEEGRVPSPEADGSQEEAEKEDSVGLLSAAPSPKGSLAGLRQHFSHRRAAGGGNGSRSGSSAGSRSPQGRAVSVSGSASGSASSRSGRSRTQSLIRTLGQRASLASLGEFGVGVRSRSRTRSGGSSMGARNEESNGEESPLSAAGTGTGSGSRRESGSVSASASASASASGTGSGRPSGEGAPGIEHTFGRGGELTQQRERLERMESEARLAEGSSLSHGMLDVPGAAGGGSDASLRRAASVVSGLTMSEATERQAGDDVAHAEAEQSRTDLSTAHASFVTAPMTIESTTTTDNGDHSRDSTWALRHHHVPGGPWGHHGPA